AAPAMGFLHWSGVALAQVVPDLEVLNFAEEVGVGRLISPAVIAWGALYAALYCAAAVLVALVLFRRREVL
ncbi:MAG TPA: hypothetical protein VMX57_02305, partial [Planctomycetota bacterium]|nr:hypothetical protein [Planctomycetota bacterium]